MSSKITKYSQMSLAGDSGNVGSGKTTSTDRAVQSALLGRFYDANFGATTTTTDLPLGAIDTTKEYEVWVFNNEAAAATNVLKVLAYDGTNTIQIGVVRPQQPWGPICCPALSGGFPKLRLQTDTGTVNAEVKVMEAGNPAL